MHVVLLFLFIDVGWSHDVFDALLGGVVTAALSLMWRIVARREAIERRIRALEDWRISVTGQVVEIDRDSKEGD